MRLFAVRPKLQRAGVMLALCFASIATRACSPVPDSRPYRERLASAPLAFVGTVTRISGEAVTFAVHQRISGDVASATTIKALPPSTCAISFQVGQRWLYAGPSTVDPSVLLLADAAKFVDDDFGRLRRNDDARLALPSKFQACSTNSECVAVPMGCDSTSATAGFKNEVERKGVSVLGDHRLMRCAAQTEVVGIGSLCSRSRCGSWSIDYRVRP